ncbi:MAG: MetS family NSS transporter small subunit [Cetobacterium sp.]|nr:MetS family NSS transporter small subunit [uncultured Cetobacterium sp.]
MTNEAIIFMTLGLTTLLGGLITTFIINFKK